jgi:glycerol-3-phosphate dehydrogenase
MVQVLSQSKVWAYPNVDFAEIHKGGNLKNRIGVQMSQIEGVKIKESTEKGINE